jgi:hypothetical protein
MALAYTVVETRPYLNKWLALIDVTDTVTGKIYNRRFNIDNDPSAAELNALATIAKTRIQAELLDYEANAMDLSTDEDRLLEYYRNIKTDIILQIRAVPGASLAQAGIYITNKYTDSPFDFSELYAIWRNMIGVSTWAAFKTWVINHKFRDID